MSNVRLPGSKTFDLQILINSCTQNNDVGLAKEFQKHVSKDNRKHGVIDQVKYRKMSNKRKCNNIEYHVQDNVDVTHKDIKMYFYTN